MSGLFTDLSWLHISRIIIRAGATGTAAHLVMAILTYYRHHLPSTAQTYHPEPWSTQLVEGLLQGAVLQEVPGGVAVSIQSSVWVTALVQSVLQASAVRQSFFPPPSYLEDLPAESWLPTDQDPPQLPEARGGHVSSADGKCASVAHSDVALTTESHINTQSR